MGRSNQLVSGSDQKEGVGVGSDEVESDEEELDEVEPHQLLLRWI